MPKLYCAMSMAVWILLSAPPAPATRPSFASLPAEALTKSTAFPAPAAFSPFWPIQRPGSSYAHTVSLRCTLSACPGHNHFDSPPDIATDQRRLERFRMRLRWPVVLYPVAAVNVIVPIAEPLRIIGFPASAETTVYDVVRRIGALTAAALAADAADASADASAAVADAAAAAADAAASAVDAPAGPGGPCKPGIRTSTTSVIRIASVRFYRAVDFHYLIPGGRPHFDFIRRRAVRGDRARIRCRERRCNFTGQSVDRHNLADKIILPTDRHGRLITGKIDRRTHRGIARALEKTKKEIGRGALEDVYIVTEAVRHYAASVMPGSMMHGPASRRRASPLMITSRS